MQGSSVSGFSFKDRKPFDIGRVSDFDVAISHPDLYQKAKQLGIDNTLQKLSRMSGGRPVNAMIFESPKAIKAKGNGIRIPGRCGK